MGKLIVGLGNPGAEYARTRHNVGFWCLDRVAERLGSPPERLRWNARLAEATAGGERVYLLFPQTFMNRSGEAVLPAVRYLNLQVERDLIVVYDDLDLPPGRLRLRKKGSAGGHNGMKSVISALGTAAFPRIRIGIGRPPSDVAVVDYVLSTFPPVERALVEEAAERAAEAAVQACALPFEEVMNGFN